LQDGKVRHIFVQKIKEIKIERRRSAMKTRILIIAVSLFLSAGFSKPNAIAQRTDVENSYSIESSFDEDNKIYIIQFNIPEGGIVSVNVTDQSENSIAELAEGEMEKGEYVVFFKPPENARGMKYNCIFEVHSRVSNIPICLNEIRLN
jgi:hypothetical protein